MSKGGNPRFIVTNLTNAPGILYQRYCMRGEMENKIKEQKLYLYGYRTSCSKWRANQFRILLSVLAYTLLNVIREVGLEGTELSHARCDTIRLKLLKIGGVVLRNTRRIYIHLSGYYPYKDLFRHVAAKLMPEMARC